MKNNQHQQNLKLKSSSFFNQPKDRYISVSMKGNKCLVSYFQSKTIVIFFFIPLQIYICIIVYKSYIHVVVTTLFLLKNYSFYIITICLAPYTVVIACIYGSPIYTGYHLFRVI